MAEAQIKVPSEMLAISESQFLSAGANQEPGGDDALFSGLASGHPFDPARHGKTYNQLWCDGHVLEPKAPKITDEGFPDGWVNFYREDDYCTTAYFYLDRPANELPLLPPIDVRTAKLR